MWHVLPSSSGENQELITDVQDLEQNQSNFRYEVTMVRISALGWASNLRNLPEMNFSQLYDYPVVSREYRHIVLRGTHYRKYHRSCSVWLRKRGKGCGPLDRGDLLLLLWLMWYLLLYHILQLKLFPFCLPICTFYLMGNYTIEPVEPLDYNLCFYQPMRKTVTNRCHNIFIPIWPRTTYARDTLKTISVHDSW